MGMLIRFPHRHARTSRKTSRAAKAVKSSAVTPPSIALRVTRTADHHSAGMLSRCHHLETAEAPAPMSAAMASREVQSSMIARNDANFDMASRIGQTVLKIKDNRSLDCELPLGHNVRMPDSDAEAQFKQSFIKRVKQARAALGWKQWQMAEALDMPQDRYKQYESRSLLPHHLIGRFCLVTRVAPEWLLTGRGEKPIQSLKLAAGEPQKAAKPKRSRATRAA